MSTNHPIALAAICAAAAAMASCGGGDDAPTTALAVRTAQGCVALTERLEVVSGDGQTGLPGATLAQPPTVRLSCESFDNRGSTMMPSGATVEWRSQNGPANLVDGEPQVMRQSAADGTSTVVWTLGQAYGTTMRIEARHGALTASFSASTLSTTTTALRCEDAGGTDHSGALSFASPTAWSAAGSPHRGGPVNLNSVLSIEAGAVVCVDSIEPGAGSSGLVSAVGTAQVPIRFIGTALRASGALAHVIGDNMPAVGTTDHPMVSLTDSTFAWSDESRDLGLCAQVVVGDAGSGGGATLRRVSIVGYGSADCAALALNQPDSAWDYGTVQVEVRVRGSIGDGIAVAPTFNPANAIEFSNCEVSASGRHGIVVANHTTARTPWVGVADCNLFGNAGNAIVNLSAAPVRAIGNWWNDAAGPQGPNGDGVSGAVDASGPLAGPTALGY